MIPDIIDRGVPIGAKKEGGHNELQPFGPTQALTSRSTELSAHLFPKPTQNT